MAHLSFRLRLLKWQRLFRNSAGANMLELSLVVVLVAMVAVAAIGQIGISVTEEFFVTACVMDPPAGFLPDPVPACEAAAGYCLEGQASESAFCELVPPPSSPAPCESCVHFGPA